MLNNSGVPIVTGMEEEEVGSERYEDLKGYEASQRLEGSQAYEGYEQQNQDGSNMATLPMRAAIPLPEGHIIVNPYSTQHPYSTQLVDNINRMMVGCQQVAHGGHIYQVAMSPQLSLLTNTLRKKRCLGGHPGPCHHNSPHHSDASQHSDSLTPPPTTETELLPGSADVVFRAVSPHGHVYWEIDPKRANKLANQSEHPSDEDTTNDLHNMSDFSEDDGKVISDRSRQSSSRFSDNRPLISGSPGHRPLLAPLPEGNLGNHFNNSPTQIQRFNSLQKAQPQQPPHQGFSTRTRLRAGRSSSGHSGRESAQDQQAFVPETLQQQVQIPDLRRIPVTVKSSEYIMAKIQNHMDQRNTQGRGNSQKERQV